VVQAALRLVLEPIFETDFLPVSYGLRPMRRAHEPIAKIHQLGTHGYRWVLDVDIEAAQGRGDCRVASMPSTSGIRTATSTTSGRVCRAKSTASAQSSASPTTSM